MKRNYFPLACCVMATLIWSCNDNNQQSASGTNADSTGGAATGNSDTSSTSGNNASSGNAANAGTSAAGKPLSKADSTFVMEAAAGGMEEVELGNLAQEKASNQRVKDFGSMMVRDHSKANDELKALVSNRGINIPASLPPAKQKEVDNMKKMSGKAFDQHYVSMMVQDHKKDVNEFKKRSTGAEDPDLKNWVGKTLPVLQTHLDSIQAIQKSKL